MAIVANHLDQIYKIELAIKRLTVLQTVLDDLTKLDHLKSRELFPTSQKKHHESIYQLVRQAKSVHR